MKGVKPKRATLEHAVDIYKMLNAAHKEGIFPDDQAPTDAQLKSYYFTMLNELVDPMHFWYVSQRGRGFVGFIHAMAMPNRWDARQVDTMLIDLIYVTESKRKNGIAKKMLDLFISEAKSLGVKQIVLLGKDHVVDYWKKQGAEQLSNYMRIRL
jgi:predicted acetyltransferase